MIPVPDLVRKLFFRAYQGTEIRDHQLAYLFLELSRSCSLRCRHCGSDCSSSSVPGLTLASWKSLADHIAQHFGTQVFLVLTGGEALEWPGFREFAAHIKGLGFGWGLVSNGFSWTPGTAVELMDLGLKSVTISLDGPEAEHNHLRCHPQSFRRAMDVLASLKKLEHPPIYDVVTCVHPGNLAHLDATARILSEAGVPAWRVFRIFPKGRAAAEEDLTLTSLQTAGLIDWVALNRPVLARQGLELNLSCEGWFPWKQEKTLRSQPGFCRSGINFASILCDGTIAGCPNNHPGFNQGSVLQESFPWVWENKFQAHRRREWLEGSDCAACRHLGDCRGGALHLWQGGHGPEFCYHGGPGTN